MQGFQHAAAMVGGIISGAPTACCRACSLQTANSRRHCYGAGPLIIAALNPDPVITQCTAAAAIRLAVEPAAWA